MRLSPLSVPYRAAETVVRFAWVVIISIVGGAGMSPVGIPFAVLAVAAVLLAAVGYQVAFFQRFEYELTDDTLDISAGVVSRREREIPYRRIQNVDVRRNPVQRALGIAELRVETAGGGETEASLRYLHAVTASQLQSELSRRKRGDEEGTPDPKTRELYAITTRELALLGVVGVDLRLLSAGAALLPLVIPSVSRQFPLASLAQTAPLVLAGLATVALVASGIQAVTSYWGFRLLDAGDELQYERGLLQQYAGTIPLEKVQSVRLSENVLARLVGHASVEVETAGYAPGEESGSQSAVPLADRERAIGLAREVEAYDETTLQHPPTRARTRYIARYTIVVATLAVGWVALLRFAPFTIPGPIWGPLALLPAVPVAAHVKWRNLGYALLDDHVVTRQGFWTRTTHVVPYYRVQTLVESASIFQRRRDLATLVIDTAGSGGLTSRDARVLDVGSATATDLRESVERRLDAALHARRSRQRSTDLTSSSFRESTKPGDA